MDLEEYMDEHGGVATVTELANLFDVSEARVRRWARANGVRRAGSCFVFDLEAAEELSVDLTEADGDEPDDQDGAGGDDDNEDDDEEEFEDEDE